MTKVPFNRPRHHTPLTLEPVTVDLDAERTKKAVKAVKKFLKKRVSESTKVDLLKDDCSEPIYLSAHLALRPHKLRHRPLIVEIPHPIYTRADVRSCLFVKDNKATWKKLLIEDQETPLVTKVMVFSTFKARFQKKDSRLDAFRDSYDIFFIQGELETFIIQAFGSTFIKKNNKLPIPVWLGPRRTGALKMLVKRTFFQIKKSPMTCGRIGRGTDSTSELTANAVAAARGLSTLLKDSESEAIRNAIQRIDLVTYGLNLPVWINPESQKRMASLLKEGMAEEEAESASKGDKPSKKGKKVASVKEGVKEDTAATKSVKVAKATKKATKKGLGKVVPAKAKEGKKRTA